MTQPTKAELLTRIERAHERLGLLASFHARGLRVLSEQADSHLAEQLKGWAEQVATDLEDLQTKLGLHVIQPDSS